MTAALVVLVVLLVLVVGALLVLASKVKGVRVWRGRHIPTDALCILGAVAVGALAVGLILSNSADGKSSNAGAAATTTTTSIPSGCGQGAVVFYADVSTVATHHYFGPPLQGSTPEELKADMQSRYCNDPALVTAHAYNQQLPGFAGLSGDDQFVSKINELISNRDEWRNTVLILDTRENSLVLTEKVESGSYQTLYMISRPGNVPLIRAASPDKTYHVLVFSSPDGQVQMQYQVECGAQPRANNFPGVPSLMAPQPAPVPVHPTPVHPTTPTTCVPSGVTENCGKDARLAPPHPPTVSCPFGQQMDRNTQLCVPIPTPTTPTTAPDKAPGQGDCGEGCENTTEPPTTVAPPITVPITDPPTTGVPVH